jgi:membrane-associated protease RseP (regulator of RpoE activity)
LTDLNSVLGPNTTLKAGQSVNLTVYRNGQTVQIDNVPLVCCRQIIDIHTNKTLATYPYIGVSQVSQADLRSAVATYSNPLGNPLLYIGCIPTINLGNCQQAVPFSNSESGFYTSSLGGALVPVTNVLYWMFFLNFNLAVFNALPIYTLDGGQAFSVGVEALGRGRFTEKGVAKITTAVTAGVLAFLIAIIAGPYIYVLVG